MVKLFSILLFLITFLSAKDLDISFEKPYIYQKNFIKKGKTIPRIKVIPTVNGFKINRAQYKNFFKLKLFYELPDKTRVKDKYEGKYWAVSQKQIRRVKGSKQLRKANRDRLLSSYKKALINSGAKLYKPRLNADSSVVFNLGNIWGRFHAYPDYFEIKAIEVQSFKQTLKIDPDKLLVKLQESGKVNLDGIYFDSAKATLKPISRPAILAAVSLMRKYPTLTLEVQGHTDNMGSKESNRILSNKRALSVKNALIQEGINPKRLRSKGYGESLPIASNKTEKGKAKNRRVVLKKLSGGDKKTIITIDFMKPMPGFKKSKTREYKSSKLNFRINQNGQKETKEIVGQEVKVEYEMIKHKNCPYSYMEILKNYEGVLESFGAKILGKNFPATQSSYFYFSNRGDAKEIYGVVQAYDTGYYIIRFFIPDTIN